MPTLKQKQELLKQALSRGTVAVSVNAWNLEGGYYVKRGEDNHWVQLVDYEEGKWWLIYDHYEPVLKKVAWDTDFYSAKLYFLTKNPSGMPPHWLQYILWLLSRGRAKEVLALLLKKPVMPTETPKMPVEDVKPPIAKKPYIRLWALAIQQFEGFKPGSASYRRNNPGNMKGLDGNFKVYKTYEEGFAALEDYLTRVCTGKHRAYKPSMTIYEVMGVYAPDGAEIQRNYSKYCADAMGVPVDTVVSTLV